MADRTFDDKALSVLTFAAYHSLASGKPVSEVVLDDGAGHRADPDGVSALQEAGMLEPQGDRGRFTAEGEKAVERVLEAIRGAGLGG